MWPFIYLVIALLMIYIIAISRANKKVKLELYRSKTIKSRLNEINDFKATRRVNGLKGFYIFAIDETNKKVAIVEEFKTVVVDYSKIAGAEIIEDGVIIAKTSIDNRAKRSKNSEIIENGEGASSDISLSIDGQKNKVSTIVVEIFLKDAEASALTITCFNARTMTAKCKKSIETDGDRESFVYKNGKLNAFQIKEFIDIALNEKRDSQYLKRKNIK